MPFSDDTYQALESYFGFLIDHELDEVYETEPLNRTLSENKPRFQANAATSAQIHVTPQAATAPVNALRPHSLAYIDVAALAHEARQRANAARSLDELYAELDAFQHMPLRHEGGKSLVRFRGLASPDLLVIGEPPDSDEDDSGQAFAGKPGEMMDKALKAAGLLERAMLAPCAFWRPAGGRPLTPEDITLGAPFLHALIRLAAPKALLLLGAPAVACALNLDQSLSKLRGRLVRYHEGGLDIPAIASYPPRFLLSQPQAKALLWRDLLQLKAQLAL
ncbi:uracil-DNA glycosylase [Asticcacaulis sp. EMRT-3]|uniref:uracil-DNA glycosylase n=1 Tax=Asticcacaulis sp. EMRT-3 TaxID=3040349 RepID=UPI0024AEBA0B|nr:uracil-DNA glycosylase [Asticcacaulis sp. EMRT-3]MDI7774233.1 uracil-DNA glycosylase [Asticcacaulis sp. EMRT-3]